MTIKPARSTSRRPALSEATTAPTVRARTRPTAAAVTEQVPAAPVRSNNQQDAELVTLLQNYAQANAVKNAGTRDEKKAKDALNKKMIELDRASFQAKVMVDGNLIDYEAKIEETEVDEIDVRALRNLCSDEQFMSIISATKSAVEAALGKNAVLMVTKKVTKPAALSVSKVK